MGNLLITFQHFIATDLIEANDQHKLHVQGHTCRVICVLILVEKGINTLYPCPGIHACFLVLESCNVCNNIIIS